MKEEKKKEKKTHKNNTVPTLWLMGPQEGGATPSTFTLHSLSCTDLAVHVVLCFNQLASVNLSSVGLTGHNVSFCLMQDLDWNADGHFSRMFLENKI